VIEQRNERNLDGYGAPPIPWSSVIERLDRGITQAPETGGPNRHTFWLATEHPDGRPSVVPLGVMWVDGRFYFTSGPAARKAKNLARNPRCVLTVATDRFDLSIEGDAVRVTDEEKVARIAAVFAADGWPAEGRGDEIWAPFSAPSAGPPPWYVYEVTPTTVFAFGTAEPYGATRWDVSEG
jgi:nitroimidazol reductase NimA-like FMN-containing flavoprotein (pyridoxamine 5'-phosphate oxidase superfamily)